MATTMNYVAHNAEASGGISHIDWLRQQQARFTVNTKTPEQIAAELANMTFEQLRARAGPPPSVDSSCFIWATDGVMCDDADPNRSSFDYRFSDFKKGMGPPPAPLPHNCRDDDGMFNGPAIAYNKWWSAWGERLNRKWNAEHPVALKKPVKTPVTIKQEEKPKGPSRIIEEVSSQSGW